MSPKFFSGQTSTFLTKTIKPLVFCFVARAEIGRKWRPKPWTVQLPPSSGRIGQVFISPAIDEGLVKYLSHIFFNTLWLTYCLFMFLKEILELFCVNGVNLNIKFFDKTSSIRSWKSLQSCIFSANWLFDSLEIKGFLSPLVWLLFLRLETKCNFLDGKTCEKPEKNRECWKEKSLHKVLSLFISSPLKLWHNQKREKNPYCACQNWLMLKKHFRIFLWPTHVHEADF